MKKIAAILLALCLLVPTVAWAEDVSPVELPQEQTEDILQQEEPQVTPEEDAEEELVLEGEGPAEAGFALPEVLPESWREALIAVAYSQLGNAETLEEDGSVSYPYPVEESEELRGWDAAFVLFCLRCAGIPEDAMPAWADAKTWSAALEEDEALLGPDYSPVPGDLVFLSLSGEDDLLLVDENGFEDLVPVADRVAIVACVGATGQVMVIIGLNSVEERWIDSSTVLGFARLPEKPVPEEPAQPETESEAEAPSEEETPLAEEVPAEENLAAEESAAEALTEQASAPENTQDETESETVELNWSVDSYAFAPQGYVLLRVRDDLDAAQTYLFQGEPLYYTQQESLLLNQEDDGVFYALVPGSAVSPTTMSELLTAAEGERRVLGYSADINSDGKVNIADANAIYQMVQSGGSYYTIEQISLEARLAVDYNSIVDFDAVINLINGA